VDFCEVYTEVRFCGIDLCYLVADENASYTKFLTYLIFLTYRIVLSLY
jgi:hypothetical protein